MLGLLDLRKPEINSDRLGLWHVCTFTLQCDEGWKKLT